MSARKLYLTAYNIVFASLWLSVFVNAISNVQQRKHVLFHATEFQARWIQTASLIEVMHSAIGTYLPKLRSKSPC
jgi:very-long-chain (3R)-3-hydroxyacyl-CoA dehydratase